MSRKRYMKRLDGRTEIASPDGDVYISVKVGHDGYCYLRGKHITEQEAYEIGDLLLRWAKQQGGMA